MVFVYILESESTGRFYIGIAEEPEVRLNEHNRGQTRSTRGGTPWRKVWLEGHPNRSSAVRREREIKSWKSRIRVQSLIEQSK